ncbi:hypothetical protein, partial [Rhodanobacter sp. 115]|uniref:hypothetical protein n=1 Tax=Rhodanobacter sp. FW021-MT20 TaxID=1162282 RepID=UPI001ED963CC
MRIALGVLLAFATTAARRALRIAGIALATLVALVVAVAVLALFSRLARCRGGSFRGSGTTAEPAETGARSRRHWRQP